MKCGRTMKRRIESNLVELKFGLKSFCLGSCHFYIHHHISKRYREISCFVV